ncbi:hypothetical protein [Thermodesulfobium sp.]
MAVNEEKINIINKEFDDLCRKFSSFCDKYAKFLAIRGIIEDIREKGRSLLLHEGKWSKWWNKGNEWDICDDYFVKEFIVGNFCTSCIMSIRAIISMNDKDLTICRILKDIKELENDSITCEIEKIISEIKKDFHEGEENEYHKIKTIANKRIAHFKYSPEKYELDINDIKKYYKRIHEILCRIYRLLLTNKLLREDYHPQAYLSNLSSFQPNILEYSDEYESFREEYREWWKNS